MKIKRVTIALLIALSLAVGASATKVVSYTLQNASRADMRAITIRLDPTSGDPVEDVQYQLRDANGNVVKTGGLILTLTAGQKTTLLSHIDGVVRPAIDTAEGL